jgi:hypothetical protein
METATPLPICVTGILHLQQGLLVLDIAWFHLYSPADVLNGSNLITKTVMGEGVQVIPFSRTLGAPDLGQNIKGLLKVIGVNVMFSRGKFRSLSVPIPLP